MAELPTHRVATALIAHGVNASNNTTEQDAKIEALKKGKMTPPEPIPRFNSKGASSSAKKRHDAARTGYETAMAEYKAYCTPAFTELKCKHNLLKQLHKIADYHADVAKRVAEKHEQIASARDELDKVIARLHATAPAPTGDATKDKSAKKRYSKRNFKKLLEELQLNKVDFTSAKCVPILKKAIATLTATANMDLLIARDAVVASNKRSGEGNSAAVVVSTAISQIIRAVSVNAFTHAANKQIKRLTPADIVAANNLSATSGDVAYLATSTNIWQLVRERSARQSAYNLAEKRALFEAKKAAKLKAKDGRSAFKLDEWQSKRKSFNDTEVAAGLATSELVSYISKGKSGEKTKTKTVYSWPGITRPEDYEHEDFSTYMRDICTEVRDSRQTADEDPITITELSVTFLSDVTLQLINMLSGIIAETVEQAGTKTILGQHATGALRMVLLVQGIPIAGEFEALLNSTASVLKKHNDGLKKKAGKSTTSTKSKAAIVAEDSDDDEDDEAPPAKAAAPAKSKAAAAPAPVEEDSDDDDDDDELSEVPPPPKKTDKAASVAGKSRPAPKKE